MVIALKIKMKEECAKGSQGHKLLISVSVGRDVCLYRGTYVLVYTIEEHGRQKLITK